MALGTRYQTDNPWVGVTDFVGRLFDPSAGDGEGSVTGSAFTTYTEASGVRQDSLGIGSGKDTNVLLRVRNGDANRPALRYLASGSRWQFSQNGGTAAGLHKRVASATTRLLLAAGGAGAFDGS